MGSHSVLIVDDDPFMRDLGRVQLESAGFDVETSHHAADALSLTRAHPFDLIIVDVAMPEYSGIEMLAALRVQALHAETPVLVLSAWSSEQVRAQAARFNASWLDKPATSGALIEAATRLVSGDDQDRCAS